MWLKLLSSEDRGEAIRVASSLRKIGARVELRECIDWDLAETFVIKGKISELKSKGVDVGKWERRIEIIRDLLKSNVKAEDFRAELFKRLYPELHKKIADLKPGEEDKIFEEFMDKIEEIKLLEREIEVFMALNNLSPGREKEIPEDPIVVVETKENEEMGKTIVEVSYYPIFELYVDVLSLLDARIDEIEDVEGLIIAGLLEIATEIISKVQTNETVEIQKLYELSRGIVESENFDFAIDCSDAFETILKSMEKSGILRIIGNRVKMR